MSLRKTHENKTMEHNTNNNYFFLLSILLSAIVLSGTWIYGMGMSKEYRHMMNELSAQEPAE